MPQNERTRIVQNPIIGPSRDNAVTQLREVLLSGGQLSANILNTIAADKRRDLRIDETRIRLEGQQAQAGQAIERENLRNKVVAEQQSRRVLSERIREMDEDNDKLQIMERDGAFGLLAGLEGEELKTTAKSLDIRHPDNIQDIDVAIGERMAQEHYQQLLDQFLRDPSQSPNEHLNAWLINVHLPNDIQKIAYHGLMTKLIRQDEERSIRERVIIGNKVGIETAIFNLGRDVSLQAQEFALDPKKFEERLIRFHADMTGFNPDTTEADISKILQRSIIPSMTLRMTAKEQKDFVEMISGSSQKSAYLRELSIPIRDALLIDAQKKFIKEQQQQYEVLDSAVKSIGSVNAETLMQDARERQASDFDAGLISEVHNNRLSTIWNKKITDIRERVLIEGIIDGDPRYSNLRITDAQQPLYNKILLERQVVFLENNKRPMTSEEFIISQIDNGNLSTSSKELLQLQLESSPVVSETGQVDTSGIENGLSTLMLIKDRTPEVYFNKLFNDKDAFSSKSLLAINLVEHNWDAGRIATLLSNVDDEKLVSAQTALDKIDIRHRTRYAASPRQWIGNMFFMPDIKGTSVGSMTAWGDHFRAYYSSSLTQDEEQRSDEAEKAATNAMSKLYDVASLDGTAYIYRTDKTPYDAEVLGTNYNRFVSGATRALLIRKRILDDDDILLDLDNSKVVGDKFYLPITYLGHPLINDKGDTLIISFPIDNKEIFKLKDKEFEFAEKQIIEWIDKPLEEDIIISRRKRHQEQLKRLGLEREVSIEDIFSGGGPRRNRLGPRGGG